MSELGQFKEQPEHDSLIDKRLEGNLLFNS